MLQGCIIESKFEEETLSFLKLKIQTLEEAGAAAAWIASFTADEQGVCLGLSELFINAIEHGNLGLHFQEKQKLHEQHGWLAEVSRRLSLPENQLKFVRIEVNNLPPHLEIVLEDAGTGFAWQEYEQQPLSQKNRNGRGILLAKTFLDFEYEGNGNTVRCRALTQEPS